MDDPSPTPADRIEALLQELAQLTDRARRIHEELREQFELQRRARAAGKLNPKS